jgi:hypothetical protein
MRSQEFPQTPLRLILTFLKPHRAYFLGLLLIPLLWAIDVSLRPYLNKADACYSPNLSLIVNKTIKLSNR